ncbi:OsmC family protein [Devosia aquimaris]|uniref:OsmC family protein n=1 Tax=Devosia aquimaris TaxID=2866214 RepID=UPI001CD04936|nr:OsmC family protein [Devosia sp. CJK-A8-3]
MRNYSLSAHRDDANGSTALVRDARLVLDTSLAGRLDAFNPVELLLASLAACMIKGVERSAPMLKFAFHGVSVRLTAERQDMQPRVSLITYELFIDTDESEHRLDLLHTNVRKYGTISNTLAQGTALIGTIARAPRADG